MVTGLRCTRSSSWDCSRWSFSYVLELRGKHLGASRQLLATNLDTLLLGFFPVDLLDVCPCSCILAAPCLGSDQVAASQNVLPAPYSFLLAHREAALVGLLSIRPWLHHGCGQVVQDPENGGRTATTNRPWMSHCSSEDACTGVGRRQKRQSHACMKRRETRLVR